MDKTLILNSAIAEVTPEDFLHPGLRMVRFIFCDDQPNDNQQGIAEEDFDDIIKSGIGTPIKMRFLGEGVGGHLGSIPVGYIKNLYKKVEAGVNQLIADAVLFADEYPDEVDYLIHSYAEGKAPGISWELKYNNSVLKDGIEWLKGLVTRAATFVRNPAYGSRTAILALASNKEVSDEELVGAFETIFGKNSNNSPKNETEGGNNRMDEELQKLQDQIAELEKKVAEHTSTISTQETTIAELTTERDELSTTVSEYKTRELIASRTAALVEAGVTLPTDPEKLAQKQTLWASMTEEAFNSTVEDFKDSIASVKKTSEATTGGTSIAERIRQKSGPDLPRFGAAASTDDEEEENPTFTGLKSKMRSISRSRASAETE